MYHLPEFPLLLMYNMERIAIIHTEIYIFLMAVIEIVIFAMSKLPKMNKSITDTAHMARNEENFSVKLHHRQLKPKALKSYITEGL